MDILDLELLKGQCYAFRYPNFEDGLDYRRFRYEATTHRESGVYLTGVDLDTGREGKWSPDMITRLEKITEPELIPHRTYTVRHNGRELSLYVYACVPGECGYKVTGRANGQFFAAWMNELEIARKAVAK